MESEVSEKELLQNLASLLTSEKNIEKLSERNAKLKQILTMLAKGISLAVVIAMPGSGVLFKDIFKEKSEWEEWKMFNDHYLKVTLKRLEKNKIVEIVDNGSYGEVRLTELGNKRVMKMGLESLTISKPDSWDGKWRMVFYDVFENNRSTREKFQHYLKCAGFYPLQKSVYLHAYPCEKEIEFLKYFLGISGSVRIVVAQKIENDKEFRDYFGI